MKFHQDKCTILSANNSKTSLEPSYTLYGHTLAQAICQISQPDAQKDGTTKYHIFNTTTRPKLYIIHFLCSELNEFEILYACRILAEWRNSFIRISAGAIDLQLINFFRHKTNIAIWKISKIDYEHNIFSQIKKRDFLPGLTCIIFKQAVKYYFFPVPCSALICINLPFVCSFWLIYFMIANLRFFLKWTNFLWEYPTSLLNIEQDLMPPMFKLKLCLSGGWHSTVWPHPEQDCIVAQCSSGSRSFREFVNKNLLYIEHVI